MRIRVDGAIEDIQQGDKKFYVPGNVVELRPPVRLDRDRNLLALGDPITIGNETVQPISIAHTRAHTFNAGETWIVRERTRLIVISKEPKKVNVWMSERVYKQTTIPFVPGDKMEF
jgi:hypothetical protein